MDTLLFIRHAETDLAGRFCGHADPPINERGLGQIDGLLMGLQNEPIDAVYCSDLSRALLTAHAIGRAFGLSPIATPALREIDFGEWEGLGWEQIEARDPAYARKWSEEYPNLPAPGGETFAAFQSRVLRQINHLIAMSAPRCGAVVTHAGVMRVVLGSLCGLDEREAWRRTSEYCAVFRYQPGIQ